MSIPSAQEYLADDFDASTLKVPQLRGILLEHSVPVSSTAKKPELLQAFEDGVRSKASNLLGAARGVVASAKGIVAVADDGTESEASAPPAKRKPGRPRKTAEPETPGSADVAEPPSKRSRGRTASKSVDVETPASVPRKRGRPRTSKNEQSEPEGDEADIKPRTAAQTPGKKGGGQRGRQSTGIGSVELESQSEPEALGAQAGPTITPSAKKRGRPRKSQVADSGAEGGDEEATPRRSRPRTSGPTASPASISIPSEAPSASRSRFEDKPSSVSVASDTAARPRVYSGRKKRAQAADEIQEESERSEIEVVMPSKEIRTPKKRRESGFSDYNPFQSGAEDAADKEKKRRKSSVGGVSTPRPKTPHPRYSEPAPAPPGSILRRVGPSRENLRTPPLEVKEQMRRDRELQEANEYNSLISQKLNRLSTDDAEPRAVVKSLLKPSSNSVIRQPKVPDLASPRSLVPLSVLFLLLLSFIGNYKNQSASVGFCDTGIATNDILLDRQSGIDDANACIARKTAMDLDHPGSGNAIECDVSALPLVPFTPRPTSCTPCPPHAECEDGKLVACEHEYLLSHSIFAPLSPLLDGLPGVGPVAFPPTCRPDTVKKRLVGSLAKEIERDLARGRGYVVCARLGKEDGRKGPGERFGMEESTLRERYAVRRSPKYTREEFDEIFDSALKDLVDHDDVIESIDQMGKSWYAAARTELTLGCRAKLEAVDLITRWKSQLGSSAALLAAIAWLRYTLKQRQREKYRAQELVQVALKRLQDQEHLHYVDPATTPNPFVPPAQLRDLVLPTSASTASKTRLWNRVVELVETNANVAVREKEVQGEVWKTWEWRGVGERHVTFE